MAQILLTPATLLSILVQIDELQNKDIQLSENPDGSLGLSIGTSDYHIHPRYYYRSTSSRTIM